MDDMAAEVRLRVWTYSRANGALPPALQSHFVPDRHLGWHLGPYLHARPCARHPHLPGGAGRSHSSGGGGTPDDYVGSRGPAAERHGAIPFPWNFHEGVILKFLLIEDSEDSDDEVISISSG